MSPLFISTGSWRLTRVTSGPLDTCIVSISDSGDTWLGFDLNSWVITAAINNVRRKGTNLELSKFILEVTAWFLYRCFSLMTFQSGHFFLSSHSSFSTTTEAGPWSWHMAPQPGQTPAWWVVCEWSEGIFQLFRPLLVVSDMTAALWLVKTHVLSQAGIISRTISVCAN